MLRLSILTSKRSLKAFPPFPSLFCNKKAINLKAELPFHQQSLVIIVGPNDMANLEENSEISCLSCKINLKTRNLTSQTSKDKRYIDHLHVIEHESTRDITHTGHHSQERQRAIINTGIALHIGSSFKRINHAYAKGTLIA
jgi:hypothetical protein